MTLTHPYHLSLGDTYALMKMTIDDIKLHS